MTAESTRATIPGMSEPPPPPPFDLPKSTSLAGHVGMLVCWWLDDVDMLESAAHAVALIPLLLTGETEGFTKDEWFLFADSIGQHSGVGPELIEIYEIAWAGFRGTLPPGPTKQFMDIEISDDRSIDGNGAV